jgi:hypothetical protein
MVFDPSEFEAPKFDCIDEKKIYILGRNKIQNMTRFTKTLNKVNMAVKL